MAAGCFTDSGSASPYAFIHNWLAAQARDLDQMLGFQIGAPGTNGGSVREEDLRRSDLFTLPWVDEGIAVYEAQRAQEKAHQQVLQAQAAQAAAQHR